MSEEEKFRVILIVSAIAAALVVHRFVESSHAETLSLYPPSVVVRR